jgi:hypothetical protein
MEYQCVEARFLFFNGQKRYTVEFCYGLMEWFIFNDNERSGAIFTKRVDPKKSKTPTRDLAEEILYEYLTQRPSLD